MEKELRSVVETYIHIGVPLTLEELNAINKMREVCRQYLDLKEFPEEKEIISKLKRCSCEIGRDGYETYLREKEVIEIINDFLHLCKLASLKDKVEVINKKEIFLYLRETLCNGTTDCENCPECVGEDGCPPDDIAAYLSSKIPKPKKIGREEKK